MTKSLRSKSIPCPTSRQRNQIASLSHRFQSSSATLPQSADHHTSNPQLDKRLPLHRTYLCCRKERSSGNHEADQTCPGRFYKLPAFVGIHPSTGRGSYRDKAEGSTAPRDSDSRDKAARPSRTHPVACPPTAES